MDNEEGCVDAEQLATVGLDPKPRSPKSVCQEQHNQCLLF